jgi:hypothetical protein
MGEMRRFRSFAGPRSNRQGSTEAVWETQTGTAITQLLIRYPVGLAMMIRKATHPYADIS